MNPAFVIVLERVLKHLNYSVDTIADAKTALEKIAGRGKLRCNTYRHQNARYETG